MAFKKFMKKSVKDKIDKLKGPVATPPEKDDEEKDDEEDDEEDTSPPAEDKSDDEDATNDDAEDVVDDEEDDKGKAEKLPFKKKKLKPSETEENLQEDGTFGKNLENLNTEEFRQSLKRVVNVVIRDFFDRQKKGT